MANKTANNPKTFTDEVISGLRENIFQAAHGAIEDWSAFPWHIGPRGKCDSNEQHSSQALCVDVFGSLQQSTGRDAILNGLAHRMGLPTSKDWEIELEYLDTLNPLREKRQTQVDAVARSNDTLIFLECKFTEGDGGGCSQPLAQCNGRYSLQTNPINQVESSCALTGKGIRYWEMIPQVFQMAPIDETADCPFRYGWYQWMRNLTNCYAQAANRGLKPGFAVIYADHPNLSMAQKVRSADWEKLSSSVRHDKIGLHTFSYQELLALAAEHDPDAAATWHSLSAWVDAKIERAAQKRSSNRAAPLTETASF